jgi:predicted acetyltransferase
VRVVTLGGRARDLYHVSMDLQIRSCAPEDLGRFLETTDAAFGVESDAEEIENFHRIIEAERCIYMAEGDVMVGNAGAFTFSMSVPGGDVPTAGVTLVGVLPSHRRKGILTKLMQHQIADIHARGEPLAALFASESTIYGRYGYAVASLQGGTDIERDRATFRDDPGAVGAVRLVRAEEAPKLFDPIYEQVRRSRPGMYTRTEDFWAVHTLNDNSQHRRGAGPLFCALHQTSGRPDAYAFYRVKMDWNGSPASQLIVREALGIDAAATREIWRFLFGIDLIDRIQARSLPIDHPLHLMLREPRRLRQTIGDALWLRIVDVEAALAARSFATADRVVISIEDPFCPWNAGPWLLNTTGTSVSVTSTEDRPEVTLTASDLAAVYLGGFTLAQFARAGLVEPSDALERLDAMLHTNIAPYCSGTF